MRKCQKGTEKVLIAILFSNPQICHDRIFQFCPLHFYLLKLKMLMTAQVIPVRTTGPVQTERTDLSAVVHQVLMEYNVKQVTLVHNS